MTIRSRDFQEKLDEDVYVYFKRNAFFFKREMEFDRVSDALGICTFFLRAAQTQQGKGNPLGNKAKASNHYSRGMALFADTKPKIRTISVRIQVKITRRC
jgi:hypothetical protein